MKEENNLGKEKCARGIMCIRAWEPMGRGFLKITLFENIIIVSNIYADFKKWKYIIKGNFKVLGGACVIKPDFCKQNIIGISGKEYRRLDLEGNEECIGI